MGFLQMFMIFRNVLKNVNEITKVIIICTVHCIDDGEYDCEHGCFILFQMFYLKYNGAG